MKDAQAYNTSGNGNKKHESEGLLIRAGKYSMVYERGAIRSIKKGETEIVRMVYAAVRDKNWGTIEPHITNEVFDIRQNSFDIRFEAYYYYKEVHFRAAYQFTGKADGAISFSMKGQAFSDFLRNRIGFCVLIPIEHYEELPCQITHSDETHETVNFPGIISPHQPFRDIRQMRWALDCCKVRVDFKGEVFEGEDQRNWSDASYKIYSTPLDLPFPVRVRNGQVFSQSVTFTLEHQFDNETFISEPGFRFAADCLTAIPLPKTGILAPQTEERFYPKYIDLMRALNLSHYRIDLRFDNPRRMQLLRLNIEEIREIGIQAQLALHFTDKIEDELADFLAFYAKEPFAVSQVLVFDAHTRMSPDSLIDAVAPRLRRAIPEAKIGAGTDAYLAELNRNRPTTDNFDLITYAACPQVHAFDNQTIVENMQGLGYTVSSARRIFNKPVCINALTLRQRFNVVATTPEETDRFDTTDPRQATLFGAAWLLGCLKYATETGAESLTVMSAVGRDGILGVDENTLEAHPRPVLCVLKEVFGGQQSMAFESRSSHPLVFDGIVLRQGKDTKVLLANYSDEDIDIDLRLPFGISQLALMSRCSSSHTPDFVPAQHGSFLHLPAGSIAILRS